MPRKSLARNPGENQGLTNQLVVNVQITSYWRESASRTRGFNLGSQVSMPFVEIVCEFPYKMDEVNEYQ